MKGHRLQFAALLVAVASLLAYNAVPAFAVVPDPPTNVIAQGQNTTATVGWTPGAPNGTVSGYTVTPTPACGGCTGLTVSGASKTSTSVGGLTNGTAYTFTVHATNGDGNSSESAASNSVTPKAPTNQCNFNSFPMIPNNLSELAVACVLDVATGGGGSNYRIEDFPQAQWHQGSGRVVTTTAATAATSKVITASAGHFSAQDVNNTISGTGVPSNAFIVSFTATTATLNKAVGSPGVANGAKLTVDNSDSRTIGDLRPSTTVAAASNNALLSSFTGSQPLNVASVTGLPSSGSLTVGTDKLGSQATLTYSGTTASPASFNNVTTVSVTTDPNNGTGTKVLTGKSIHGIGLTTITSATAHFCKVGLGGCNSGATQKNDVGRTLTGTMIQHGTTISMVNSATSITISAPTIACPLDGVGSFANCNQMDIGGISTLTTARQIQDATFVSPNKVCSATAGFGQTDVNGTIASVAGVAKIPAGNYITAVGASGCPGGTTEATLKVNWVSGVNANVVIGGRNSSAPMNGDAIMSLSSELSPAPGIAAGLPACNSNTTLGSSLVGKWLNPGSFDSAGLGKLPNSGVTGAAIAEFAVVTGAGNPAFDGYVVLAKAGTAGDLNTAAHFDIVFPTLLTGVAVCPAPNNVGVASVFRFFGSTLSQSASGHGDVRSLKDLPAGVAEATGTAHEHVIKNPATELFATSGTCTDSFPTTLAQYVCGGN